MTICPTCTARRVGDPPCPLHPQASAYRTQRKTTQPDNTCTWTSTHPHEWPATITYILGCICDKCGNQVTVTLCTQCSRNWAGNAPNARCGPCNGTLSWQLHDITTGDNLTQINPSQLP